MTDFWLGAIQTIDDGRAGIPRAFAIAFTLGILIAFLLGIAVSIICPTCAGGCSRFLKNMRHTNVPCPKTGRARQYCDICVEKFVAPEEVEEDV